MAVALQGQWHFEPGSGTLVLLLAAMMMGMPAAQEQIRMRIVGREGAGVRGQDAMGRHFVLQRVS